MPSPQMTGFMEVEVLELVDVLVVSVLLLVDELLLVLVVAFAH